MMQVLKMVAPGMFAILAGAGGLVAEPDTANAESCWMHNGTLMRLKASGNNRMFLYERPRKRWMRPAGIRRGTLLFNGTKNGNTYSGTARRFSKHCPGQPLTYQVSGPVSSGQTEVTLWGEYEVHKRCRGTGRFKQDELIFTYSHQC